MAQRDHVIVDIDAHYTEPFDELAGYMDDPWRTVFLAAGAATIVPGSLGDRFVGGRIRRDELGYKQGGGAGNAMTPADIPFVQRKLGVDASIVVSNAVLRMTDTTERRMTVALYNAYIDYMLDKVVDAQAGIYTMPMVPWQDPKAGAALIRRVAAEPGVVGACFCTSGSRPALGDETYDPVYAAAQEAGLPVAFHGTPGQPFVGNTPFSDVQSMIAGHFLGFTVWNVIQLCSLLLEGVPEKFPELKFVFEESGLFWVPMMMYRLDEYYLKRRSEAPLLRKLPSEYLQERFYFGTQPIEAPKDQRHMRALVDMIGSDRILYASDYPHFDYDEPSAITRLSCLSSDETARILGGNAIEAFNLTKGGTPQWLRTSSERSLNSLNAAASS